MDRSLACAVHGVSKESVYDWAAEQMTSGYFQFINPIHSLYIHLIWVKNINEDEESNHSACIIMNYFNYSPDKTQMICK